MSSSIVAAETTATATTTSTAAPTTLTTARAGVTTPNKWRVLYQKKLGEFREENLRIAAEDKTTAPAYIVFLGDSITQGYPIAASYPGIPIVNRGIASDTIGTPQYTDRGVLNRLKECVTDCRPAHVFLQIGINDLGDSVQVTRTFDKYEKLVQRIRDENPGVGLSIVSLFPLRGRYAKLNRPVLELNAMLKKYCDEHGLAYIDIFAALVQPDGLIAEPLTTDGLHLTKAGYEVWTRAMREAVEKAWADAKTKAKSAKPQTSGKAESRAKGKASKRH